MQSVTLPGDAEETETWMESGKALARILKIYTICRNYALDKASKHFLNIINSFWDCHIEIVVYT